MGEYKEKKDENDCLWLMTKLKAIASGSDSTQHHILTYVRTLRALITSRQRDNETIQEFHDKLESNLQAFKLIGGKLPPEDLVDKEVKNKGCSKIEAEKVVEERIMAILTVDGSNDLKYKSLKVNLANQMVHTLVSRQLFRSGHYCDCCS